MELLDCIGQTPLIRLPNSFTHTDTTILVKLEEYNWGGSIKSRVGKQMILDAEAQGQIDITKPNDVVILEATGGNTGIGLAQMCAIRGYKCVLVVPDNYSKVRIKLLKDLGAEVILSDSTLGNDSHIMKAKEILSNNPSYIYMDQFKNPSNVKAHYLGTGPEILSQYSGNIDCFVAGIGSGGTITGVGKVIKERFPNCKIIGIQPEGCDILRGKAIRHIIQGIAIGQVPQILDVPLINAMISVSDESVLEVRNALSKKLGLFLGYSSIANIIGAIQIAQTMDKNKVVVTVSPDGGRNY